jgi:hypothetical protein
MFELIIPKRTMFFMGPQRAGKTFALQQMVKVCAEMRQRILLVGTGGQIQDFMEGGDLYSVGGHTIDHLPVMAREATAQHLRASAYDLVAFVEATVLVEPGKVLLYSEPSPGIVKFFERLCEPTAMLPRVYFETHYAGTERDVALG